MASPQWTTRPVDAPADDLLTAEAVGKLLGFGAETLGKLVKAGEFPDGVFVSPGVKLWEWRAVAYYRLRVEMKSRLKKDPAETGGE
jgi:predicted DNA-binding transcriptional regulator AlpA